jgi:uncharacterized secreted protein with C-terminal beta-propeller domain
MSTRRVVLLIVSVVIAVVAGLWLHRSDEERVREAAEAIMKAANQDSVALTRALEEHASDEVSVTVADLPEPLVGRSALVAAAARTPVAGSKLSFRMQAVDVSVEGINARLNADFVATVQLGLRGVSRARRGVAVFQKIDGRFRLMSAEIGEER